MWAIFAVFILAGGYVYVDADLPSKYKLRKSDGWKTYFLVALKGVEFVMFGLLLAVVVISFLYASMFVLNIPTYIFGWYSPFSYAYELMGKSFLEAKVPFIIWGVSTLILSVGSAENIRKYYKSSENRVKGFREIAKSSAIESIILESLDKMKDGVLLFITLKSRKVYIGVVDGVRLESMDTSYLTIIPFISGYRDEETLTFHKKHDYSEIYNEMNISSNSSPLTINQFRVVIPQDEIDSLSLFHLDVYERFQKKDSGNKELATTIDNQDNIA